MKNTGITRKIDELGRLVIPKEIRKNYELEVGDNLEFLVDENNNIVLKKFSKLNNINKITDIIIDSLYDICNHKYIIFNKEIVVSKSKNLKIKDKRINTFFKNLLSRNEIIINKNKKEIEIDNNFFNSVYLFFPINVYGYNYGGILVFDEKEIDDNTYYCSNMAKLVLERYLEE